MAETTFLVDTYRVQAGFKSEATFNDVTINAQGYLACYGKGHFFVTYFLNENSPVAKPFFDQNTKRGAIFVPMEYMETYVSLARNEKLVYVYMNSQHPEWNHMRTSREPIGEEEI